MTTTKFFLIGYMGSGKTETGKALHRMTGFSLLDMDQEIEREQGRSIPEIFETEGETEYRRMEAELLARLCAENLGGAQGDLGDAQEDLGGAQKGLIVSCGGGVIELPQNVELLAGQVGSIFLYGPPELLFSRIKNDTHRPNARADIADEGERFRHLCSLYERREPFYRGAASRVVNIEGKTPDQIAAEILFGS